MKGCGSPDLNDQIRGVTDGYSSDFDKREAKACLARVFNIFD
jgi:hypothetical protein